MKRIRWRELTRKALRRTSLARKLDRRLRFECLEERQLLSVTGTTPGETLTGLAGPGVMAFDHNGNLFVANDGNGSGTTISEFAPGSTIPSATLTGVSGPLAMAFDANGNLYVANNANSTVSKFAPGATVPTATLTGVGSPDALAIDSNGNVFVGNDRVGQTVSEFAPGSLTPTSTLVNVGAFPFAIVVDSSNNVYVSSQEGEVTKFAPGSTTASATLTGLSFPRAMTFDKNGDLFVANNLADTVSEFTPGSTTASATLTGLNSPDSLAFDSSGNLYVVNNDFFDSTVSVFSPGSTTATSTLTGLSTPKALAFDSSGNLYVSNDSSATTGTVSVFNGNTTVAPLQVTTSFGTLNYAANSGAQAIDSGVTITDTETSTIASATVAITSGYSNGEDVLGFTNQNGIAGAFNAVAGTLSLSGTATVANYQAALESVTYTDTAHDASTANRFVSFVVNDGLSSSNTATKTVSPQAVVTSLPVSLTPSATLTGLNAPAFMAFDANGNLFVADSGSGSGSTVSEFAPGATTPRATLTGLSGPTGMIFDSSGNLYVANFAGGAGSTVSKFAPGSTTPTATLTGLNNPEFMAFDSSGNLYVSNSGGTTVSVFAPGSTTPTTTLTGLNKPRGLSFNASGVLYVANYGGTTVSVFTPGATTPSTTFTGLSSPWTVAFDSSGNIFVANGGNNTVSKFAPGNTTASATLTGVANVNDMLFDSSGNLYVANGGISTTISVFAPGAITPTATLTGLDTVFGLAFDSNGNLYAANHSANTVSEFDTVSVVPGPPVVTTSSGALIYAANSGAETIDSGITLTDTESSTIASATVAITSGYINGEDVLGFTNQNGITGTFNAVAGTLSLSGTATVANYRAALASVTYTDTAHDASTANRTVSFSVNDGLSSSNTATKTVSPQAVVTTPPGNTTLIGLFGPQEIVINSVNDVYVSNFSGTTVSEYAPGSTVPTTTLVGLSSPSGLALDSSGDLYVSNETSNGTVSKFLPGSTTASVTLTGLNSPLGLTFDASGNLYVANFGGTTVSKFAPGSTVPTAALTGLNAPIAMAFDSSGNLYVANLNGNTVSKFAPGSLTPSATLTGLSEPAALMFGPNGNLYVVNRTGNTVSEFAPGSTVPSVTLTGLNSPRRLAFDASGDLFVVNADNNTVSEFAPGSITPTATLNGLSIPHGLAFDSLGNLYVVNQGNNTVSVFKGLSAPAPLVVTTSSGILNYAASSGPQTIDPGVTISDTESSTIVSATVAISSGYSNGEDVLSFTAQNGITGVFNAATGTLSLSGTATVANYQAALESVAYTDTDRDASIVNRSISFSVNDGLSASNKSIKTISPQSDVATQLVITAQPPATVTAGAGFSLTVTVEDAQGFTVPHYSGSVNVTLSSNLGNGTLGGTTIVNVSNGLAVFSNLTLNRVGSGYQLTVASSTLAVATSNSISVNVGAAAQLLLISQPPASVTAGSPFGVTVLAEDAEGNAIGNFNGNVTVALLNNPASGSLTGTLTASASNGLAGFSDLSLIKAGTNYSLLVTSPNLSSATTVNFAVTAGAPTQLVISTQPPTTVGAGNTFAVTVAAEDVYGNVANDSGNVTIALANNPGGSTLGGTLTLAPASGLAVFSDLTLDNLASGYTLQATGDGLQAATTSSFSVGPGSVTINGTSSGSSDDVSVSFDGTQFMVNDGGTPTPYSTSKDNKFVYNGPTGTFSKLVFDDPSNTYTVTQSLTGTQLMGSNGFELDLNNVSNLFVYGNANSTATVNVLTGVGSNFFVDSVDDGYSYIADPITHTYSELSGFGGVTVTGSGANTYAYIYSTSNAKVVGGPGQTTYTAGGVTSTLSNFSQVYVVGAPDGTDSVTLDSAGGTFVGTPQFSYVEGTSNGASFFVGALYAANVTAQAAGTTDTAIFYSYPHDTFNGAPGSSSLAGSTTIANGTSANFVIQASAYDAVSVFESGAGTDVANLTSPGHGSFYGTSLASTLTVGSSTITVNTYFVSGGQTSAVPGQIVLAGNGDGTDSADVYDAPGNNALTASGSTATLTTALGSLTINKFGSLVANQENGAHDTVHQQAIDFALKTVGNWTSD